MTNTETQVIPEAVLDSVVKDYFSKKQAPVTYGEWQLVEFGKVSERMPSTYFSDHETVLKTAFIFRNVESDHYFRATICHDLKKFMPTREHQIVRVFRKLVPVYEEA